MTKSKKTGLPFGDDITRWGRIQRAGQRFADLILRETTPGLDRDEALNAVRGAILAAQASTGPQKLDPEPEWMEQPLPLPAARVAANG
jgi:hypothetical protein